MRSFKAQLVPAFQVVGRIVLQSRKALLRILANQFRKLNHPKRILQRGDHVLFILEVGVSIVDLHTSHALNLPVHAFFRVRDKCLSVSAKDQIRKFLRRLRSDTTQAERRIGKEAVHFGTGNQQHSISKSTMPIDEKVIVISGVLGEHQDGGACLLRRRNDLFNRSNTVM